MTTPKRRSPATAAILNFFFWGAGYVYLGRQWGLFILIPACAAATLQCAHGVFINPDAPISIGEVLIELGISAAGAWHAYKMAEEDRNQE